MACIFCLRFYFRAYNPQIRGFDTGMCRKIKQVIWFQNTGLLQIQLRFSADIIHRYFQNYDNTEAYKNIKFQLICYPLVQRYVHTKPLTDFMNIY